jgi:hypothetical protein
VRNKLSAIRGKWFSRLRENFINRWWNFRRAPPISPSREPSKSPIGLCR